MARIRNFIIDNNTGYIFSNTTSSYGYSPSNIVAYPELKSQPVFIKPPGYIVQIVSAVYGWTLPGPAFIPTIQLTCVKTNPATISDSAVAPIGSSLNVNIRKVTSLGATSNVATVSLSSGSANANTLVNLLINTGDTLYADVTQIGSSSPGSGLRLTYYYYGGTS